VDIGQAPNAWSKESLLALRWGLFKIELAVAEVDDLGAGVGEVGGLDAVEAAVASAEHAELAHEDEVLGDHL